MGVTNRPTWCIIAAPSVERLPKTRCNHHCHQRLVSVSFVHRQCCFSNFSHCMQQILESVNYCHQMSIVHRDLKVGERHMYCCSFGHAFSSLRFSSPHAWFELTYHYVIMVSISGFLTFLHLGYFYCNVYVLVKQITFLIIGSLKVFCVINSN